MVSSADSAPHSYVFAFQECGGAAWPLLQTVYSCRTCGHTVHGSCLVNIRRPCVGAFLNRLPGEEEEEGFPKKTVAIDQKMIDQVFTMELSPLQFAPSSHWRSSSTSVPSARSTSRPVKPGWVSFKITILRHFPPFQVCDYTGQSYCPNCHWGVTSPSPARILSNWDFTPQPMAQVFFYLDYNNVETTSLCRLHCST